MHGSINVLFMVAAGEPVRKWLGIFAWGAFAAMLATHGFRAWIRRNGWLRLSPLQVLPRVFLGSTLTGIVITGMVTAGWPVAFGLGALAKSGVSWIFPATFQWSVSVFLWAVLYFGVHYFESYQSSEVKNLNLEVVAKDAQLRALLAQVNPHFIFNCLNSLRALIVEDPPRAQNMVTELSNILRYSLQSGKTDAVSLEAEIEAVTAYLKLESIRLEDRLRIKFDIDPDSLFTQIPPMLVQTLVENGVKHGVAQLPKGGEIRVASKLRGGALKIQVLNSGQLLKTTNSTRVGLENIRQRLRLLYGDGASLVLSNQGADFVLAEVSIPLAKVRA
jgi:hypothetical protein